MPLLPKACNRKTYLGWKIDSQSTAWQLFTDDYTAKARYNGSDTFAIKATGQGPRASGTSVIIVHATIK